MVAAPEGVEAEGAVEAKEGEVVESSSSAEAEEVTSFEKVEENEAATSESQIPFPTLLSWFVKPGTARGWWKEKKEKEGEGS